MRERVRYLLLEHLAVTIRGSIHLSSLAAYQMQEQMAIGSIRTATIFGRQERAEASWAALANGIASHGLEMDDVENRSSLPPGAVVFPAALALAHIPQCAIAFFAISLVELLDNSTVLNGFPPQPKKSCGAWILA